MLPDHLQVIDFNKKLKSWYLKNHRPLLWRQTTDPYKIWLVGNYSAANPCRTGNSVL